LPRKDTVCGEVADAADVSRGRSTCISHTRSTADRRCAGRHRQQIEPALALDGEVEDRLASLVVALQSTKETEQLGRT